MAKTGLELLQNELARMRENKAAQASQAEPEVDIAKETEQAIPDTKNGGGKFGKGLLYLGEELGLGLVRGIEGVGDFVVGGVADLFGGDAFAERVMKNDWLNYSHADEWFDPGKGWEFAGDVASGVGGMLPSVAAATAITLATGGAGAGAGASMLAQGVGTTLFGLGAAGQATSETVKETGELGGKEWLYGVGSGALETGIELASGGIGGSQVGKVFGKKLAKSTAGKIASTVVGEGLEEVASDVANPLLRRATGLDKSLAEAYKDVDAESLLRTFAVGGLTGAVMGGGSTAIGAIKSKGYNNYAAAQTAEQVSEWKADTNKSQAEGKKSIYKQKDIAKVSENLSKRLQNMDDTSRGAFLKRNANIAYMFNADGTVTENAAVEAKKGKKERAQLNPEGTTENIAPTTATNSDSYNPDAYSAGLKGYEGKLEYKPVSSSSKVSSEVKGVMNTLAKISRGKANIVLTDADFSAEGGTAVNGLYKDGIIYLNANATDYQKALAVGVHEVVHTLEGTKDYDNLARHIADVISKDPALQEKYNQEKYRKAYDALLSGDYTETTKNYQASTEIFADYIANELAGNEASVKRLINKDRNIVVRILDWVKNAIAKLGMSKEERAMRKDLEKLENLLSNALEAGTGGRPLEDVEKTARAAEKAHLEDELKKKKAAQAEETQEAVAQAEETEEAVAENATTAKEKPSTGRASLAVDSAGNTLTAEQAEYFKDSKVRDKDGNLLVVYHGTNSDFYTFDKAKIKIDNLGRGFYLVNKKQIAESYAERRTSERGGKQRVLTCYLLVEKPFDVSNISETEIKDFLIYDYMKRGRVRYDYRKKHGYIKVEAEQYAEELINDEDIPIENGKKDYSVLFSTNESNFQEWLKERGYDGLIVPGTDKKTNIEGIAYVVFDSNQIKLTTNKTPTKDADIRYSLDTELAKKTSDRVQTIVKDKGVVRQTISDIREGKKSVKETWDAIMEELKYGERARWIEIQIALTDQQAGIAKAAKNLDINVNGEIQRARAAKAAALNMLIYKQTDFAGNIVGESLREIFDPIQKKGAQYAQNFNEYLLHQLNIDRMSLEVDAKNKIKQLFKNNPQLQDAVNERYDSEEQWREGVKRTKGGKEYLSLLETENKPVFQEEVTAEFSKERIAELDKQHPTFKDTAEKVWKYNKNLLQYRVDAGLITQAQADQMNKMYPHYVPAFYDTMNVAKTGASVAKNRVAVRTGIKAAKGSSGKADIIDVSLAISRQTESVVRAAAINNLVTKLYDKAVETSTFIDLDVAGQEKLTDPNVDYDEKIAKDNQVVFYKDGKKITLDVSEYMYAGFEGLGLYKRELNNPLESVTTKGVEIFKKLVTSWNPLFAATNAMKDLSDALFNTRYNVFKYMGRYVQSAFRFTSKKDSEYRKLWDAYRGMGGFQAGFYKGDLGAYDKRSGLRKGIARFTNALNNLNDYIEQIPRFAEFVASVKAGNSYEKALYDAADVTTNFSRGGSLVRKLNRSWIPFLNPAVQGWSKMYRTFFNPMDRLSEQEINKMTKSAKGRKLLSVYGELALKTLVLGFGAGALNDLLFRWIDEDEDYEKLPLNVKENYYLIKSGDKFIKIPKGRVTALFGMVATRIVEYANGNEEALDAWNWFTTAWGMVSPIDAASRHIASPVFDVLANRTWYGTEIESRTMEQMYEAKDRYDESTSSIAIAIGQALNMSPKKIHYFLDQYSGVLGDIILPMTTNKAEQGMIAARFVVDPLYTNNISNEYYNLKEELTYAKSAKDLSAMMVLKYLNKSDDKLSEIYQLKRDVANYEDLSTEEKTLLISKLKDAGLVDISNKATLTDVEKREITNLLQALLNGTLAQLTENVETFEQIALDDGFEDKFSKFIYSDMYIDFDEKKKNTAYNKAMGYYYELYMSKMLGVKLIPKYALYDAIGANETALYLTEISKIESDKDRNGDTITGSRKKKVHKYIQGLELTVQQKNILMYLAGYTPTDAGKGAVNRYLLQNGYTRKEIDEIWN